KFLRSEIEWVRSHPKARTCRNQGRLKRFFEVNAIAPPRRESFMELVIPPAAALGNKVASYKHVALSFDDKPIFRDFTFAFEPGMRLGIIGRNGIGKTSMLKLMTGELTPDAGTVAVADTVVFNYIDQGREQLHDDLTVLDEIGEGNDHIFLGGEKITVWTYLKRFMFVDERIKTRVGLLSGGERARLLLAKQLKRGGNFIILDEPTNDLDLPTLRLLEEALADYRGCVAVVSHDRYFLNRICTGILSFDEVRDPEYSIGDYDYYYEMKARCRTAAAAAVTTSTSAKPSSGDW
ncbi:MAG: ATP-binding cassette domain-containing protein, partial [Victivallales bacterium]|nr:ATP-binding cassette domain-containing protein [Victivallales bacterium]